MCRGTLCMVKPLTPLRVYGTCRDQQVISDAAPRNFSNNPKMPHAQQVQARQASPHDLAAPMPGWRMQPHLHCPRGIKGRKCLYTHMHCSAIHSLHTYQLAGKKSCTHNTAQEAGQL